MKTVPVKILSIVLLRLFLRICRKQEDLVYLDSGNGTLNFFLKSLKAGRVSVKNKKTHLFFEDRTLKKKP